MKVVTRFAPSPTGELHIGSARTALFNYLYAKKQDGKFFIRIEDTDQKRSSQKNTDAILTCLAWLDIKSEEKIIYQSKNINRHLHIVQKLIDLDCAYYCYISQEEIDYLREKSISQKKHFVFRSPYRDKSTTPDSSMKPVVRLKVPLEKTTLIKDLVQGQVSIHNNEIEDVILLRSNQTPTYNLAVVSDDIDISVTHLIRGIDHLTNSFRQILIYEALECNVPHMLHIPLITNNKGLKLSKRQNDQSIGFYQKEGFLPEAVNNYLMRLGWSYGNKEIIRSEEAKKIFNIENLRPSPSKFDLEKLIFLNKFYIKEMKEDAIIKILSKNNKLTKDILKIKKAINSIKQRATNLNELQEIALLYTKNYNTNLSKAQIKEIQFRLKNNIQNLIQDMKNAKDLTKEFVKNICTTNAIKTNISLADFMKDIRMLITGMSKTPSIFEMIEIIEKEETIKRLNVIHKI